MMLTAVAGNKPAHAVPTTASMLYGASRSANVRDNSAKRSHVMASTPER
jgi:hypothetical protein